MKRLIDGPGAASEPVAVPRTHGLVITPKGRDAFERTLGIPPEALTA